MGVRSYRKHRRTENTKKCLKAHILLLASGTLFEIFKNMKAKNLFSSTDKTLFLVAIKHPRDCIQVTHLVGSPKIAANLCRKYGLHNTEGAGVV